MELNPLVLVGGAVAAVAAYAFSEKKKTEDVLVAQALPVAAQQVQMGVPVQQAAQQATTQAIINVAVKNAVPVAVQLIKTGTPPPTALQQAIDQCGLSTSRNFFKKEYHVYFTWAPGVTEQRKTEILKAEGLTPSGARFGALLSFTTFCADSSPQIIQGRLTSRLYGEMQNVSVAEPTVAC